MAIPTYTTDLVQITTADSTTGFTEPVGSTAGGVPVAETDFYIQGTGCISKTFNATAVGGTGFTSGTSLTIPTDGVVYVWCYFAAPNALATKANGGMQVLIGTSTSAYRRYYVAGSDTYTYGGWVCFPVSPLITPSATNGTSPVSDTFSMVGSACNLVNAVSKGNPYGLDVMRYGRGALSISGGDFENGYANFLGAAFINDNVNNRWGILSYVDGGYKMQGLVRFAACDFRDSNKNIVIQNTEYVNPTFNGFEVSSINSNISLTNISVSSLGTVSKGDFNVLENAPVALDGCTFTDLNSFLFKSNSNIINTTFRRCGTITSTDATFSACGFARSTATSAVVTNNPSTITYCDFTSSGTGHAITITAPGTYTFTGNGFAGYSGTSTNAAIYNNSGGLVTLNISGGGDTPSVRNGTGATTNVVSAANVRLTGLKADSEVRAYVGTNPATAVELGGVENSTTEFTFGHSVGGQAGYIQILHVGYQPVSIPVTYSNSDITIPIQQVVDRQYARGTVFNPS